MKPLKGSIAIFLIAIFAFSFLACEVHAGEKDLYVLTFKKNKKSETARGELVSIKKNGKEVKKETITLHIKKRKEKITLVVGATYSSYTRAYIRRWGYPNTYVIAQNP